MRSKHVINMENVLEDVEEYVETEDLESVFRKTKWLLQKELNLKWHIATLTEYIKHRLIPRSLRWDLSPDDVGINEERDKEWAEFFVEKGLELVNFIIKRKQRRLLEIQKQIDELKKNLEPAKKSEKYVTRDPQSLRKNRDRY